MSNLLAGKVAAITGAVTGIGRAIALEYIRQGALVAINHYPDSQSAANFQTMLEEVGDGAEKLLIAVSGDISKPETGTELVRKTVEAFGRLDIFVSNAGVCQFSDFLRYAFCSQNSVFPDNRVCVCMGLCVMGLTTQEKKQPEPRPPTPNRLHKSRRRLLRRPSRRTADERTVPPRRQYNRCIIHQRPRGRCRTDSLHAHKSRCFVTHAELCVCLGSVWYQV